MRPAPQRTPDLVSTNHGTIITITAETRRGRQWLARHVEGGKAGSVQCEHRSGIDILYGALADGLQLQDTTTGRTAEGAKDA